MCTPILIFPDVIMSWCALEQANQINFICIEQNKNLHAWLGFIICMRLSVNPDVWHLNRVICQNVSIACPLTSQITDKTIIQCSPQCKTSVQHAKWNEEIAQSSDSLLELQRASPPASFNLTLSVITRDPWHIQTRQRFVQSVQGQHRWERKQTGKR